MQDDLKAAHAACMDALRAMFNAPTREERLAHSRRYDVARAEYNALSQTLAVQSLAAKVAALLSPTKGE